ncbi:hypothetical protein [Pseudobacillus wudalianchiensis]|uniref:Lipoyl-binding domain-containing protein n=1 Tax=Pseudobacillus wudalianchiensis TaxID=1743143 RepID=A0A1B9AE00_9BACI|nr:hypothetical protein [Bacillus wudalianchiensis]OCA82079.1 hypothetical protein A8F95_15380 [Bacillus wudalianchiensis]
MFEEWIISPYQGVIQQILVKEKTRIYEWEPLFIIKGQAGVLYSVMMGVSGEIQSIEVQEGDYVLPDMVLAYVKEEVVVSPCD